MSREHALLMEGIFALVSFAAIGFMIGVGL